MTTEQIILTAREGFVMIRMLMNEEKIDLAKELADALHNLPLPGDEFCMRLTLDNLARVVKKDKRLAKYFSPYVKFPATV